ncbi:hypothetical protein N9U42_03755 [Luminiphilus sp.]|nr:hypothetical protein [Luminiphilus sp.]MDA9711464.1 hypothetical protein [Luminiphilus sp.]
MKWLFTAIAAVVAVVIWTLREPVVESSATFSSASNQDIPSFIESEPEGESFMEKVPPPKVPATFETKPVDGVVINIGEPMDPDDPSTWPQPENTEVINIGEPMDPDDPSTWPQPENTEVINIGEPMDPDDPSTWPQPENTEVINIGEPMDPDGPSTRPQPDTTEVINIGEPVNPDDPFSW